VTHTACDFKESQITNFFLKSPEDPIRNFRYQVKSASESYVPLTTGAVEKAFHKL